MSTIVPNPKILKNKTEIKAYLGDVSDYVFAKFIEKGMPARFDDKNWLAHADNIDEWLRGYTRIVMKKVPDET
jgi:hypothetical protein